MTTQPWYPGWAARTEQGWLPVEAGVDGALVGVELPAGEHEIQVRYWPGLSLGLAISGAHGAPHVVRLVAGSGSRTTETLWPQAC